MKIFTTEGIRRIDEATIERESIKMLDLMERAASAVVYQIISRWPVRATMAAMRLLWLDCWRSRAIALRFTSSM